MLSAINSLQLLPFCSLPSLCWLAVNAVWAKPSTPEGRVSAKCRCVEPHSTVPEHAHSRKACGFKQSVCLIPALGLK